MKTGKLILPLLLGCLLIFSCNNNKNKSEYPNPTMDTTTSNPTSKALNYGADQSQVIPRSDSSNTIGTDTLNASQATTNTGTNKSYNDMKGNKDSSRH